MGNIKSNLIGGTRLLSSTLLLGYFLSRVDWNAFPASIAKFGIGGVVGLLLFGSFFYYQIIKGVSEIDKSRIFHHYNLQNFVIIFSLITIALIVGNIQISHISLSNPSLIPLYLISIYLVVFALIDFIELLRKRR